MQEINPIPFPKMPITLQVPKEGISRITPAELRKELAHIGLDCEKASEDNLRQYIDEIVGKLPKEGKAEGWGVLRSNMVPASMYKKVNTSNLDLLDVVQDLSAENQVFANWEPTQGGSIYSTDLLTVGIPKAFDFLQKNYKGFAGQRSDNKYSGKDSTIDAIKQTFLSVATNMSSALMTGVNQDMLQAALVHILEPVTSTKDYDQVIDRFIFLVLDYNEKTKQCEGIGILHVRCHLVIKNYKEKKKSGNTWNLDVEVRVALYSDPNELKKQVVYVTTHLKDQLLFDNPMPFPVEVKIYETLPPASEDTYTKSLPVKQTENDLMPVLVLYAPDLDNVGCLDNTESDCSATYSKTITSGFTFTAGQKLSAELSFEAGVVFAKAGMKVGLEISFSEQWNKSQSETTSFTLPGRTKAFLYQGKLKSAVLNYNTRTRTYSYGEKANFLTNMVKTTEKPIISAPVIMLEDEDKKALPQWRPDIKIN